MNMNLGFLTLLGVICVPTVAAAAVDPGNFPPPAIRLTNDASTSVRPRVTIDGDGNAAVIWQDARYGNNEILWQKFSLEGVALTSVIRITENSTSSVRPDVSWSSPGIHHVVWQEGESNNVGDAVLARRDNLGLRNQWDVPLASFAGDPRVAGVAGGEADVVWYRRTAVDQDVYYRRYHLDGSSSCLQRFNAGTIPDFPKSPVVAVHGDASASFLWYDMNMFWSELLMGGSVSATCARSSGALLSASNIHQTIDVAGSRLERVFDLGGRIRRVTNSGSCQLSQVASGSTRPSVGTTADTSYVVWQDTRNGNLDIYFSQYVDCISMSGDLPLTLNPEASENPDIAVNHTNGEWVAVWQTNVAGNTEIYLTSSRLLGPQPQFRISSITSDKQLYHNGTDTAIFTIGSQSFSGVSYNLTLRAILETNQLEQFDLGSDAFPLAVGASHSSTFQWPVPSRNHPWDFDLIVELRDGELVVASARMVKAATGTHLSEAEVNQLIAQLTYNDCAPPGTKCATYLVGLIPGFGFPAALASFQAAVCEAGRQSALGNDLSSGLAGFRATLPAAQIAFKAAGASLVSQGLLRFARGLLACSKSEIDALFPIPPIAASGQGSTIDTIAAEIRRQAIVTNQPYSNEILAQGPVALRIGANGTWTSEDSLGLTDVFVFPSVGPSCRWGHVGLEPVAIGSTASNPNSRIEVELVATAAGSFEFGVLHHTATDSIAWVRWALPIPVNPGARSRVSLSDSTIDFVLQFDAEGDGFAERLIYPNGVVVDVESGTQSYGELSLLPFDRNPVVAGATLRYNMPSEARIVLQLFDVSGRMRLVLDEGVRNAGWHQVSWLGAQSHDDLPAGVYFVRLSTPWGTKNSKVVVLQ